MDKKLLVEQIESGREFIAGFNRDFPVTAAFWVRHEDSDKWRLFVVSDESQEANLQAAYRKVLESLPWDGAPLTSSDVHLARSTDSIAKQAIAIQQLLDPRIPHHYSAPLLAGMPIEGVYLYETANGVPGWAAAAMAP